MTDGGSALVAIALGVPAALYIVYLNLRIEGLKAELSHSETAPPRTKNDNGDN